MHREKIEAALAEALKRLENSAQTLASNDEKAFSDTLWSASSEAEYSVFLLSLTQSENQETPSWKHSSSAKQTVEPQSALTTAQQLLQEAKTHAQAEDYATAYKEAWTARSLLLRVQEFLEKKRKEQAKK